MKYKIGDKVKSFFGNGIIKEYLQKDLNLYKIELSEGEHKGKMPWFAEHELEIIYEEVEEETINSIKKTTKLDKLFENFNDKPSNYKVSIDWESQEKERKKTTHETIYEESKEEIINPEFEGEEDYD